MNENTLLQMQSQTEKEIDLILGEMERVESSLMAQKEDKSMFKIICSIAIPGTGIIGCLIALLVAWLSDGYVWSTQAIILLALSVMFCCVFLALQIVKVALDYNFYNEIFHGLDVIKYMRGKLQSYKEILHKKYELFISAPQKQYMVIIDQDADYLQTIEAIDQKLVHMKKKQLGFLDGVSNVVYYLSSFLVASLEMVLLRTWFLSSLTNEWWELIFYLSAMIAVFLGPIGGTYYLHTCRGYKISTVSFLWILLDGFLAFLVCVAALGLIYSAILLIIGIVKIVIDLVIWIVCGVIAIAIAMAICGGS